MLGFSLPASGIWGDWRANNAVGSLPERGSRSQDGTPWTRLDTGDMKRFRIPGCISIASTVHHDILKENRNLVMSVFIQDADHQHSFGSLILQLTNAAKTNGTDRD
jgi:hypothetical protein